MNRYKIKVEGFIWVTAENLDDATEKIWDGEADLNDMAISTTKTMRIDNENKRD
jgi:hypothetical protein